jgi:predicted enzyme related to lactoylglutathione lyase
VRTVDIGSEVVAMAHGVVHWEIAGQDLTRLREFYAELFGWATEAYDARYAVVPAADGGIGGGLMQTPPGVPPYVTFYVAVDDLDESLARVKDLGGTVVVPPTPIPGVGAFAMFTDPEGNTIGIMRPDMRT